jgi:hypothetical protein
MKLVIKTADIEIEYEDEYAMLESQAKDRIESLIKTIYSSRPTSIHNMPIVGTVEEIFNKKK